MVRAAARHPHGRVGRAVFEDAAVAGKTAAEVGHEIVEGGLGALGVGDLTQAAGSVGDPLEAHQRPEDGGVLGAFAADAAVGVCIGQQPVVGCVFG